MNNKQWFQEEAKFGMMIHWGLYTLLAGEYRGKRIPHIGEWAQSYFEIPNAEYEKLAEAFNPIYFDPEEWVLAAKAAGMNYMVVTSKHHEGFCLFHSAYDTFNVVDGTPFGRDVIGELSQACPKARIKVRTLLFPGARLARAKRRRLQVGQNQLRRNVLDKLLGLS